MAKKWWVITKEWPLASKFSEFEYSAEICHFWRIRVLAKMAFFGNVSDSPDLPTFAKPCCTDSPDSPTFAKPCHKRQVWQVLREFSEFGKFGKFRECRLDRFKHIKYLCIKRPILLEPTFIKRLGKYSPDSPTFAKGHF